MHERGIKLKIVDKFGDLDICNFAIIKSLVAHIDDDIRCVANCEATFESVADTVSKLQESLERLMNEQTGDD